MVGFPLYTFARYDGMGRAPVALRRAGLLQGLGRDVRDDGDIQLPPLMEDISEGGVKNLGHFTQASELMFRRVRQQDSSDLTICLGGECSFTVGALAGFKHLFRGRPGMLWIDSHGDFNTPETSPSGYIGGMCLAMDCGRGPRLSESIQKAQPLLQEENLVHLGPRALDKLEMETMRGSPMGLVTMKKLSLEGIESVSARASSRLSDAADWIVCHLDVDVMDQKIMPSVNYPSPNGMSEAQVVVAIKSLRATGKLRVLDITAYNPDLDKAGSSARLIIRLIQKALRD